MSASSKTMAAFFPPHSRLSFFIMGAAMAAMRAPTTVLPVNDTILRQRELSSRPKYIVFQCLLPRVLVLDHGLPDLCPQAADEVEHALGHADLVKDLGQHPGCHRRHLGRLHHDGVAGKEGGRKLKR